MGIYFYAQHHNHHQDKDQIMNGYIINFLGYGDTFAFGETAMDAIKNARRDIESWATKLEQPRPALGSASARKAVYGELDCGSNNFTIDGKHHDH